MSESPGEAVAAKAAALRTDAEIVARILAAVEDPFRDAWRQYGDEVWDAIRDTLRGVAETHARALAELSADEAGAAGGRYRRTVAAEVLAPLGEAVRRAAPASSLAASLSRASEAARAGVTDLPARVDAPLTEAALARRPGLLGRIDVRRLCARVLRPLLWRRERHDVPVAAIARRHLERVVEPRHAQAFEENQRRVAVWLARLERAWAGWIAVALAPPREPGSAGVSVPTGETGSRATPGGPSGGTDLPDGLGPRDGTATLCAAGEVLQRELLAVAGDFAHAGAGGAGTAGIPGTADTDTGTEVLRATVAAAGTFVASDPVRPWRGRRGPVGAEGWDVWVGEAAARLDLYRVLVGVRLDAEAVGDELVAAWRDAVREADAALADIDAALRDGRRRARRLARDPNDLHAALESEQRATAETLEGPEAALRDPGPFDAALADAAGRAVRRLEALGGELPAAVRLHGIPEAGRQVTRPAAASRVVRVRGVAARVFGTSRMTRIREAPVVIAKALREVGREVAELSEVAAYGYEVALAELSESLDAEPEVRRTLAHATEGLMRAGDKLRLARETLFRAAAAAEANAIAQIDEGVGRLVQHTLADRPAASVLRVRSYVEDEVAHDWRRWRHRIARRSTSAAAALRATGDRGVSLARTLGLRPPVPGERDRGVPDLDSVSDIVRDLPVVYRRLFSFEPLADPRLLAGRDEALDQVSARWRAYEAGGPGSLLVVAQPGAGVTSFLNVAATRLSQAAPGGVRRTLRDRESGEARFTGTLGAWLGLDAPDDGPGAASLSELADEVLRAPEGALPAWVILEGAELLHLRTPEGGGAFERLVTFITRTESRLFWVVSINAAAWQLIRLRARPVVSSIRRLALAPLGPDELREAIFARHRRSGIPLRFAEPSACGAARLHRWLRTRTTRKRSRLIEAEYFRRLHRAALGSVRLALVHWLRSADLESVPGHLLVRPLATPFPSLDGVDVDQSFALKALLEHGTLTPAEFGEVMRTGAAATRHTLRSLAEMRLIEALDEDGTGDSGRSPREPRYRIRPLMLGVVGHHLRSRNILHD